MRAVRLIRADRDMVAHGVRGQQWRTCGQFSIPPTEAAASHSLASTIQPSFLGSACGVTHGAGWWVGGLGRVGGWLVGRSALA
jgi:hypothetical protein